MNACTKCHFLTEEKVCPKCSGETSKEWQGYCIVTDYSKSLFARKMGITANGRYALRVR